VIWREAPLETVLCVVDATTPPAALDDALLRSQVRASDVVALSKVDLVDAAGREQIRRAIAAVKPAAVVVDTLHGQVPTALLFPADADRPPVPHDTGRRHAVADRFETHSWTSDRPKLARAKGLFETMEQPGRQLLFQLAGGRATLAPVDAAASGTPRARIVFIAEIGVLSTGEIDRIMDGCISGGPGAIQIRLGSSPGSEPNRGTQQE
jgi:G3E family GTPase